jgi:hypothetical protein
MVGGLVSVVEDQKKLTISYNGKPSFSTPVFFYLALSI